MKLSLANFMPLFSTKKRSYTASDHSHAHWIRLHSTTHSEVSRPLLLWIGNCAWIRLKSTVAADYEASMGNLAGRSFEYERATDPSNIGPSPNFGPCKVHHPWALFCEGMVYLFDRLNYLIHKIVLPSTNWVMVVTSKSGIGRNACTRLRARARLWRYIML